MGDVLLALFAVAVIVASVYVVHRVGRPAPVLAINDGSAGTVLPPPRRHRPVRPRSSWPGLTWRGWRPTC